MTAPLPPPVVDQEFVVHLFAPLRGPDAATAYQHVRQLWTSGTRRLQITQDVAGLSAGDLPSALTEFTADDLVAVRESDDADRYCVLRQVDDVLNISIALAQPAPEGLRRHPQGSRARPESGRTQRRRLGWTDFDRLWASVSSTDGMLGEARIYLARTPPGSTAPVKATAELGHSIDRFLSPRTHRAVDWWQNGTTTADGFAVWDTKPAGDTSCVRDIVLIAAADQDDELSAWAWSDGTASFPPFARYLMHAAKLRFEARLLDAWHRRSSPDDIDQVLAELTAAWAPEDTDPEQAELLRSRLRRLRTEETKMVGLQAELARLGETVRIARANLSSVPGSQNGAGTSGIFAADQALARWLTDQIDHDLSYVTIDLDRIRGIRAVAADDLRSPPSDVKGTRQASGMARPDGHDVARRVFVVHGRDGVLATRFYDLLRSMKLEPLEWETLVRATGSPSPYLGQVVAMAPHLAQATLVLLSPDDIVELHSELFQGNDQPYERARSAQARPNVYFELGLALMAYPDNTIVVEVGQLRTVADLAGLNVIRFDGSSVAIKKVLDRLRQAGCPADDSGVDWLEAGRFSDLTAYRRGPATHHVGNG